MPSTIEGVHRRLHARGLTVWAVNLQEPPAHVAEWVRQKGLTMPILLDPSGAVSRAYRVSATPTAVLVDRAGRLVGRAVGIRAWDGPRGRALLEALLAAPAP